jgi:hypothetical protein
VILEAPPPPAPCAAAMLAASRPFAPVPGSSVSGASPRIPVSTGEMWVGKGSRWVISSPQKASHTTSGHGITARESSRAAGNPARAIQARILPRFLEVSLRVGRISVLGVRILEISLNGVRHYPVGRSRGVHRVGAPKCRCPRCLIVRELNSSLSHPHHTVRTENTEAGGLLDVQEVPHLISKRVNRISQLR